MRMEVLTCKMCGGNISVSEDQTYATCEYCGSTMTLPKIGNQQRANLYNRANHFRRQNEFDKAMAAYENILNLDSGDPEAHWGIVLSRFGIEYVEDPVSHERIPTCHRTRFESILADEDYHAALDCAADDYTRSLYEKEAKRIAEIQKGILAISSNEKPYDVFICYKETDADGNRTKDSVLAQDIYYQLVNEGYKVFFARITLEDKLGQQYEPYIFSALNSARVMLAVGTSTANFNAVWVRNEWKRYLDLMKKDQSRVLIPCYRDMDPYDLPEELSLLQSQDMSKLGFIQDLIRGVKKILGASPAGSSGKQEETGSGATGSSELDKLLKNAQTYLRLNDYDLAKKTYSSVIEKYPEDYRGWWGLIICETRSLSEYSQNQKKMNTWFGYIRQLVSPEEFSKIEQEYVQYLKKTAGSAADKEIANIKRIMNNCAAMLRKSGAEIENIDGQVRQQNQYMQQQAEEYHNAVHYQQSRLDRSTRGLIFKKIFLALGLGLIGAGIISILISEMRSVTGVVITVLLIVLGATALRLAAAAGGWGSLKANAENARETLDQLNNSFVALDEQYKKNMAAFTARAGGSRKKIEDFQKRIELCRRYMGFGRERIIKSVFANQCRDLGIAVQDPKDEELDRCRYQIYH